MTKRDAMRVNVGDRLIQLNHGTAKPFRVTAVQLAHPDSRAAVPLFHGDPLAPDGVTYKLVRFAPDPGERRSWEDKSTS